jgi:hypothetical protein
MTDDIQNEWTAILADQNIHPNNLIIIKNGQNNSLIKDKGVLFIEEYFNITFKCYTPYLHVHIGLLFIVNGSVQIFHYLLFSLPKQFTSTTFRSRQKNCIIF